MYSISEQVTESKIQKKTKGSRSSSISSQASSSVVESISSTLEGTDPLSQFAAEATDPLSRMAAQMSLVEGVSKLCLAVNLFWILANMAVICVIVNHAPWLPPGVLLIHLLR